MKLINKCFRSKFIFIISMLAFLSSNSLFAQSTDFTLKGRVVEKNGALPGATVSIKGKSVGTTTDSNGNFELKITAGQTILVSFIGFNSQEIEITANKAVTITLEESDQFLKEVVVIGYGTMLRKDLTGSIQSLGSKDITKSMEVDVTAALNGRVSGVLVTKASNRPGADMKIEIRGKTSFTTDNAPLYVIDGVPSFTGMRHLNPDDIESIDVLKDASSNAIYGSRGANGVIIVTTKGASKREGFNIEYNGTFGFKTPTRIPEMLGNRGNGKEYVDFRILQWTNKFGANSLSSPAFLTEDERRRVKNGEYYDWLREFAKDGTTTNHTVSASGGSKNTSYTFGLGYMNDGGVVPSENFNRATANVGLEQRAGSFIKMGVSAYLSNNEINHGSTNALYNAYLIAPIVGRFNADGTPTFTHRPGGRVNPFLQDENTKNISEGFTANGLSFIELSPIKALKAKSQFAMQYDNVIDGTWNGMYTQYGLGVKSPLATRKESIAQNWVWDNTLTFDQTFAEQHKINVITLFSLQKEMHKSSEMTGEGLPYDSDWHAIGTADQITGVNSSYWEARMVSFMGRFNYTFRDKYMFTATGRYDGTSRLAQGNQWGLLPAFAIGWHLKNEDFLKDVSWMDALRLRLSWGQAGKSNIGHNITKTLLKQSVYSIGGQGQKGFGLDDVLGNTKLKWETTSEYNLGLDFAFFKSRVSGSIEMYSRQTIDQISWREIAQLNGFNKVMQNIGTIGNKGIEVSINSVNVDATNFKWNTNLNFSMNKNKIIDLDGTKTDDLANRRFIGHPVSVIYDVEQAGIWQIEEKEQAAVYGHAPGWIKLEDKTPDGKIDANDMRILGAPMPNWTAGMTNTFAYKNIDLSVYVYTRVGGLYSDPFTFFFTGINNQDWNKLNVPYWTPENRNNKYPGVGLETLWTQVLSQTSGTFLKVQNITMGYTFNPSMLEKIRIKNLRLFASVLNPFTFSSYLGSDPEIIGEDLEKQLSLYPIIYSFGVNVKF